MEDIQSKRFLGWWLFGSVIVYPIAGGAVVALLMTVGLALDTMFNLSAVSETVDMMLFLGFIGLAGLIIGGTVGMLQRNTIRHHIKWDMHHWEQMSAIGGIVGGVVIFLLLVPFILNTADPDQFTIILMMPLFVLCLSFFQFGVLRQYVQQAWLWTLTNVVGGLIFSGMVVVNLPETTVSPESFYYVYQFDVMTAQFAHILIAMLLQGLVTGFTMLWLFERHAIPFADETVQDKPHDIKSVWDEVI